MGVRRYIRLGRKLIGEGNGNPLQCSCLEYPRDRGAWWAAVYGVAQSRTRRKRLSSSSRKLIAMEAPHDRHISYHMRLLRFFKQRTHTPNPLTFHIRRYIFPVFFQFKAQVRFQLPAESPSCSQLHLYPGA